MEVWEGAGVAIGALLAERWNLTVERVEVLAGGMNSRVWLVVADDIKLVVKSVDQAAAAFEFGLGLAARLDSAGITTGAPVPSRSGALVEAADDRLVALLQYIDGVPLTGMPANHKIIGTTLGRVHAISQDKPGDLSAWFELVTQFDEYLDYEPWIRSVVQNALDGVRELAAEQELSWAGLHGDPAPEAFLQQPSGEVALIDWGGAMTGPALYDLASAVMYLEGAQVDLVAAYLAERPESAAEVSAGLMPFLRFRWAVQASYFAWRCATDVRTGLSDDDGNAKGLADARRSFGA
jgi:homoserine kinase type II